MKTKVVDLETTYVNLVNQINLLESQREFLKVSIIEKFEEAGKSRGDKLLLVIQERTTIDDLALKAALPVPLWNKIRADKVDKEKLEAAIKMGEIKEELAERAISRKKVKALRIV